MITRSKEFWLAAFYLSKFSEKKNERTNPPSELNVSTWKEAYQLFFKKLSKNRTVGTFANSLKNARDSFDGHIKESQRQGWKDEKRRPALLPSLGKEIFDKYYAKSREQIWSEIKLSLR